MLKYKAGKQKANLNHLDEEEDLEGHRSGQLFKTVNIKKLMHEKKLKHKLSKG